MASTRRRPTTPLRLILDSGAVIALSRNDARARAVLTAALEVGASVAVPSVVVAETLRGRSSDAPTHRVLNAVGHVLPADERIGRTAGALLGASGSAATVDAIVVAHAIEIGGAVVLTGDAHDLVILAAGRDEVVIQAL